MFAYKPTFSSFVLKKGKGPEYVNNSKSRGLFKTEIHPLHNAFLPNIKRFGHKLEIQFNNTSFVKDKNNYATKIVNAYIAYDLEY